MYFIFTNLVVSVSASLLCLGIGKHFLADLEWQKALFVFFSTLSVYNFQRMMKISTDNTKSEQMLWMSKHRLDIYFFTLLGSAGSIYLFVRYFFHPHYFLMFIPAGIVCFLYALKFLKLAHSIMSLRELPFLKIFLISGVWCVACFWFPLINHPKFSTFETGIICLIGFFYVLSVTIPFDIRDLKYDSATQKTIPQIVGWKKAKWLSLFLLTGSYLGLFAMSKGLFYSPFMWVSFVLHLMLLVKTNPDLPGYYFSGGIDGVISTLGLALYFS